jgi:predicted secreted protein
MCHDEFNPDQHGETRRQFLKKTGAAAVAVAGAGLIQIPAFARERGAGIAIVLDASDPLVKQAPATATAAAPVFLRN